jgi:hypothetical protein
MAKRNAKSAGVAEHIIFKNTWRKSEIIRIRSIGCFDNIIRKKAIWGSNIIANQRPLYYIFNKQTQNRLTASKLGKNKINGYQ